MTTREDLEALPVGSVIAWEPDYVGIKNWDGLWEIVGPLDFRRDHDYFSSTIARDVLKGQAHTVLRVGR